jgi:hypothetical protein
MPALGCRPVAATAARGTERRAAAAPGGRHAPPHLRNRLRRGLAGATGGTFLGAFRLFASQAPCWRVFPFWDCKKIQKHGNSLFSTIPLDCMHACMHACMHGCATHTPSALQRRQSQPQTRAGAPWGSERERQTRRFQKGRTRRPRPLMYPPARSVLVGDHRNKETFILGQHALPSAPHTRHHIVQLGCVQPALHTTRLRAFCSGSCALAPLSGSNPIVLGDSRALVSAPRARATLPRSP